ncbi:hypothetical protein, partial [Roseivivax isoporae]
TTIQDTFHANAKLLARHGVIYPDLGPGHGHHGLSAEWYGDLAPNLRYREPPEKSWARVAEPWARRDVTVFLSTETLSMGHPNGAPDYAAIRRRLDAFDEVEVVCVLREQRAFMQSTYLEVSRKAVPPTPAQIAQAAMTGGYCAGLWTNYAAFHDRLRQGFGAEEIRFLDYGRACAAPGGILGTMLDVLGVTELKAEDLTQVSGGRSNPSPPALPVWAALAVSQPVPPQPWLVREATETFEQEFGPDARSCIFTRAEYERLGKRFGQLDAALAERLAAHQPGFSLSPAPLPDGTVFREDLGTSFWVQFTRRLRQRIEASTRAPATG